MEIEVPAHQVKLFTISNGEGMVPIGVDDTVLPQLHWDYRDGELILKPLKDNEGIYIYSERQIDGNFICKKIFDKVYLIKGRKGTEQIIIK